MPHSKMFNSNQNSLPKIAKFISSFPFHNIDGFLITNDINIRYLTDFCSSESWLLVASKKSFYITDFRYVLEARRGLRGIKVESYSQTHGATAFKLAKSSRIKRLGFDDRHISLATFKKLKKECPPGIRLVPVNNLVERLREVKSIAEIDQIRRALEIHSQAYAFIKSRILPGRSEKEILNELECYVRSKDACFSFPPIIASGPNSCLPHARVSDRIIRKGDLVLIDMGIDLNGYKSDLTRMVFLDKIPRLILEVCDHVRRAQSLAIEFIRPGRRACEVDFQARNYLTKNRLGKYFGHSLGHGVGLEIHEDPRISQKSSTVLKEGMVITVEPAVYIPHKFGIRLEEMVLVTRQGCEVISGYIH